MKLPPNKSEIRQQLQQEMERFLDQGGAVSEIPRGQSGIAPGEMPPPLNHSIPQGPVQPKRECLLHVTRAIDERRSAMRKKTSGSARVRVSKSPRKVAIYDDFGEVVRWEWRTG